MENERRYRVTMVRVGEHRSLNVRRRSLCDNCVAECACVVTSVRTRVVECDRSDPVRGVQALRQCSWVYEVILQPQWPEPRVVPGVQREAKMPPHEGHGFFNLVESRPMTCQRMRKSIGRRAPGIPGPRSCSLPPRSVPSELIDNPAQRIPEQIATVQRYCRQRVGQAHHEVEPEYPIEAVGDEPERAWYPRERSGGSEEVGERGLIGDRPRKGRAM